MFVQPIADAKLSEAIESAEKGLIDADDGDGLIKQRIARQGEAGRLDIVRYPSERVSGHFLFTAFLISRASFFREKPERRFQ